jgi:starch synthase
MVQAAQPERVRVHIGYDEARAHRLVAGADAIAVPSRFEPCGLTQLYGLRYGTLPIVRHVGGLADTVADGISGLAFGAATPAAFERAVQRALEIHQRGDGQWQRMMAVGMAASLGWADPARRYLDLYAEALAGRGRGRGGADDRG